MMKRDRLRPVPRGCRRSALPLPPVHEPGARTDARWGRRVLALRPGLHASRPQRARRQAPRARHAVQRSAEAPAAPCSGRAAAGDVAGARRTSRRIRARAARPRARGARDLAEPAGARICRRCGGERGHGDPRAAVIGSSGRVSGRRARRRARREHLRCRGSAAPQARAARAADAPCRGAQRSRSRAPVSVVDGRGCRRARVRLGAPRVGGVRRHPRGLARPSDRAARCAQGRDPDRRSARHAGIGGARQCPRATRRHGRRAAGSARAVDPGRAGSRARALRRASAVHPLGVRVRERMESRSRPQGPQPHAESGASSGSSSGSWVRWRSRSASRWGTRPAS